MKDSQNKTKMKTSRLRSYRIMGRIKGLIDELMKFSLCCPNKLRIALWNCSFVLTIMYMFCLTIGISCEYKSS